MRRKIYDARTVNDIQEIGEREEILTLTDLGDKLRYPASEWTYQHLVAYRLLRESEVAIPNVFDDHKLACPLCDKNGPSSQSLHWAMVEVLLQDLTMKDRVASETYLLQHRGAFGPFLIALAQARSTNRVEEPRDHPKRKRKEVERKGYADSSQAISGSSSSPAPPASDFEEDESDMDYDKYEERRCISEAAASRLANEISRYVLQFCLVQNPDATEVEIRPRVEHRRSEAYVGNAVSVCEDDGGIGRYVKYDYGWVLDHAYFASFEVKRAQKLCEDPRTGNRIPRMSNVTLAQTLGEAVLTWYANQELLGKDFFLINVNNTFFQVVHYEFSDDYGEYLNAATQAEQERLLNDRTKKIWVKMKPSKWRNLDMAEGRRFALCVILALLRWHERQDKV